MVWPIAVVNPLDRDQDREEKVSNIQKMKDELSLFVKRDKWFKSPHFSDSKWNTPYKAAQHMADYSCELLEVPATCLILKRLSMPPLA